MRLSNSLKKAIVEITLSLDLKIKHDLLLSVDLNIMSGNFIWMLIEKHSKKSAFLFYSFFFLTLFIQFPLKKALSGNCDTWLALTYSGYTLEVIKSFFTGGKYGMPMYPVENPLAYGESAPGVQLFIMLLRFFGLYDHWINYFYISAVFALTAWSIFIFAGNLSKSFPARLFAGFVFTCSNMSFAHIDDSIIIFFFIPVLSMHYLWKWFGNRKQFFLITSSVLAGIEIYFSFYVFFYQFLMLTVLAIYLWKIKNLSAKELLKPAGSFLAISFTISAPHFLIYLYTLYRLDFVTPFEMLETAKMASLNPVDLLFVLPDNLIYPNIGEKLGIPMNWGFVRHYNFIGFLAQLLFLYSFFDWNRHRKLLIALGMTGIFFATGPVFMFNMKEVIYSPLYVFYKWIPVLSFLRVAVRAHFIFLFAVSIGAAITFEKTMEKFKLPHIASLVFFAFHFIENTPFPLKSFDASITEKNPQIYEVIQMKDPGALILELPSTMTVEYLNWDNDIFNNPANFILKNHGNSILEIYNIGMFVHSWDDIFQFNREIIYTNWQLTHKLNSINGVNGYFPAPRMIWQYHINRLPEAGSFRTLKKWGVDYIIWHDFMKIKDDSLTLDDLKNSGCVRQIYASERSFLFNIEGCDE